MPTKIEWTDETWSPVTGCTPISEGCKNCYAQRMARRLAGRFGYPEYPNHFRVTLHYDRLTKPLKWKKQRMIFVCSMSDLFHKDVEHQFRRYIFDLMVGCKQHIFQVLTKRPENVLPFWLDYCTRVLTGTPDGLKYEKRETVTDWPKNIWLGVTIENQEQADIRTPILLQIPAAVRFVSAEPLLNHIDFMYQDYDRAGQALMDKSYLKSYTIDNGARMMPRIDWIITGAETGPGKRPMNLDWARSLRDQCQAAGVPFFFKKDSNGNRLLDGKLWEEMPQ